MSECNKFDDLQMQGMTMTPAERYEWQLRAQSATPFTRKTEKTPMNASEYQALAMRTKNHSLNGDVQLTVAALGLCGEAGKVAEHIKKHVTHGQPLDIEHMNKELGDVMWYITLICDHNGLNLSDVMERNIDKLRKRWPDGFDTALPQAAGE